MRRPRTLLVAFAALAASVLPAYPAQAATCDVGGITYTVTISLEKIDPRLLWNMTAMVTIH